MVSENIICNKKEQRLKYSLLFAWIKHQTCVTWNMVWCTRQRCVFAWVGVWGCGWLLRLMATIWLHAAVLNTATLYILCYWQTMIWAVRRTRRWRCEYIFVNHIYCVGLTVIATMKKVRRCLSLEVSVEIV